MKSLELLRKEIVNCCSCPRLVLHRQHVAIEKRASYRDCNYWGKPLAGFGDLNAQLLIVGLAPAAHGGNRTGRIFTGDRSGEFLMRGLHANKFANQPFSVSSDDGLVLTDAFMTAVVRCAPPDNKPLPSEILNCRSFLLREIALLKNVCAVLALGKIAMDGYIDALSSLGEKVKKPNFKHGAVYELPAPHSMLFVSYHPSQQNTQTGRLTIEMFNDVLQSIRRYLG